MSRILIAGLPRSGTTWLAEIVGSAPRVHSVLEPDNWELEPLAAVGMRGFGRLPVLAPGDQADDYRLMWAFAFAGGWSSHSFALDRIFRVVGSSPLPHRVKLSMFRRGAQIAAKRVPPGEHQLVKSVFGCLAIEWIAAEFDPTVLVVWRHPLNLVSARRERGWRPGLLDLQSAIVRSRFEGTAVWPPPAEDGLRATAWVVCGASVLIHETLGRHPDWVVVSHEQQCLNPPVAFRELFARLELDWTQDVEDRLSVTNNPGSGYETKRRWAEEPLRWRSRLSREEQDEVIAVVDRFEQVSPVAAAAWRSSPAVGSARAR